ncbi:response regulator transcription factor [Paenibacillus piri]|uniref:Response regulator n=1 Tax=Paenibacillus piri TaxID=2547395 RepID=A0A4R5KYN3_9BACL|nr:response regulator [Paenibacillus piri]TDG00703.1 response regulator [Paenibacillus piri]
MMMMHRLLIVDDEPYTVDGLYDLFNELPELELEIYKAYSAVEALRHTERIKFDIVLTDIRMPTMSGLELQQEIRRQWPRCKVIFLTGYSDFHYAQAALQNGGYNYLLKTDGDEQIISTVVRAIEELSSELENEQVTLAAKHKMQLALPSLQRDYVWSLLHGGAGSFDTMGRQFDELGMPLDADCPVYPVYGRVDAWWDNINYSDQSLLLYAIQNIIEEYLCPSSRMLTLVFDRCKLLLLIQPGNVGAEMEGEAVEKAWMRLMVFVQKTLESIQTSCNQLLHLTLSFSAGGCPVPWERLGKKIDDLKLQLMCGPGNEREMILYETTPDASAADRHGDNESGLESRRSSIDLLEMYLLNGQEESFLTAYRRLTAAVGSLPKTANSQRLELYCKLATMFLGYINRYGLSDLPEIDWVKLTNIEEHASWEHAVEYFEALGKALLSRKRTDSYNRGNEIICKVNQYVEKNLAKDLSLTQIAEHVFLNPAYLSRLYKQFSGVGLSEFIVNLRMAKSKEMLKQPKYKIHEIASDVGFDSAYFTRFFKKQTNMTPQEYRNQFLLSHRT